MSAFIRAQRLLVLPLLVAFLATALVATTWLTAPQADAATKREKKIHHAVKIARNQIGDPYSYGANGPGAFDCSGLTSFAYHKAGLYLPRTSDAQYRFLRGIKKKNMHKGDLMAFHGGGGVYHVGIFVGWRDGRRLVLHAPNSGSRVHVQKTWTGSWWAATARPKN